MNPRRFSPTGKQVSPNYDRCVFLVIVASILSGCAAPKYNYTPKITNVSEPPLNTVVIAQVGDEMAKQGTMFEHDVIRIRTPIKVGVFGEYTISPGYFKKMGEDKKYDYYIPYAGIDSGAIRAASLADPYKCIAYSKNSSKIGIVTVFNATEMTKAKNVSRVTKTFAEDDSFQQTLIYSGKVGNIIRMGYREFSNNRARPAFNNDVEYDLGDSTTIGYKGARIEILEATNEHIKYKLLQNFKPVN